MANRIKGIIIEIGGDIAKLPKALDIYASISTLSLQHCIVE